MDSKANAAGGATGNPKKAQKNDKQLSFNKINKKKDNYRFKRKFKRQGLKINTVTGDGNCLFRAIAD